MYPLQLLEIRKRHVDVMTLQSGVVGLNAGHLRVQVYLPHSFSQCLPASCFVLLHPHSYACQPDDKVPGRLLLANFLRAGLTLLDRQAANEGDVRRVAKGISKSFCGT